MMKWIHVKSWWYLVLAFVKINYIVGFCFNFKNIHTYVKKGMKFFKTVRQFFHGLSKHFRRCIQIGMYIYLRKVSIPTHVSSANYNSKDKKTCNILKMFLLQRSSPSCFAKKKFQHFQLITIILLLQLFFCQINSVFCLLTLFNEKKLFKIRIVIVNKVGFKIQLGISLFAS